MENDSSLITLDQWNKIVGKLCEECGNQNSKNRIVDCFVKAKLKQNNESFFRLLFLVPDGFIHKDAKNVFSENDILDCGEYMKDVSRKHLLKIGKSMLNYKTYKSKFEEEGTVDYFVVLERLYFWAQLNDFIFNRSEIKPFWVQNAEKPNEPNIYIYCKKYQEKYQPTEEDVCQIFYNYFLHYVFNVRTLKTTEMLNIYDDKHDFSKITVKPSSVSKLETFDVPKNSYQQLFKQKMKNIILLTKGNSSPLNIVNWLNEKYFSEKESPFFKYINKCPVECEWKNRVLKYEERWENGKRILNELINSKLT